MTDINIYDIPIVAKKHKIAKAKSPPSIKNHLSKIPKAPAIIGQGLSLFITFLRLSRNVLTVFLPVWFSPWNRATHTVDEPKHQSSHIKISFEYG